MSLTTMGIQETHCSAIAICMSRQKNEIMILMAHLIMSRPKEFHGDMNIGSVLPSMVYFLQPALLMIPDIYFLVLKE